MYFGLIGDGENDQKRRPTLRKAHKSNQAPMLPAIPTFPRPLTELSLDSACGAIQHRRR